MPELVKCYWEVLINLVKPRKAIWDTGSKEFKDLSVTTMEWQDIFHELQEIVPPMDQNFTVSDLKERWSALRCTYRRNRSKLKVTKSGIAPSEIAKVKWPYFQQMTFLESSSVKIPLRQTIERKQRNQRKQCKLENRQTPVPSNDFYDETIPTLLSSTNQEDVCDYYGKTIASELRFRIAEGDRPMIFRKMLQVIDDSLVS